MTTNARNAPSGNPLSLDRLPASVIRPGYEPARHGAGMVHLGLGSFHKAHQAVYADDALAAAGGDWRITGVSLRSTAPAAALEAQNGLFTVIETSAGGARARVIGSLARALSLTAGRAPALAALTAPETRIVSLTVTEKGYGIDRATGGVDQEHAAIAHDLENPHAPRGVAGLLVWALGERRRAGIPPFAVLCCDNLPDNGRMLRALLVDFARRAAPGLEAHIADEVAFPATMVDRITPAANAATLAKAQAMTGWRDQAAVETEAFRQWVIEDCFPGGRPRWEAGGAVFTSDVRPYEQMKLRMLNGTHSLLAYAGFLAGHACVRDAMADAALAALARRHLAAAAATLTPLPGVDFNAYADALAERFANPHLAHETRQIAMDGSEKLPQRILAPALAARRAGQPLDAFAFAVAAWMRHVLGRRDDGRAYRLEDPRAAALCSAVGGATEAAQIAARLLALPWLFPAALAQDAVWSEAVTRRLAVMQAAGMRAAIQREAET